MNSVVVLTKQGVRNLNALGPKKKPDEAKRAKDAGAAEGAPEEAPAELPKAEGGLQIPAAAQDKPLGLTSEGSKGGDTREGLTA